MLNFHLTDDQLSLRERARQFAVAHVLPVAWYYDEKDEIPVKVLDKAMDAGFMNADIPAAYGGQGVGLLEAALVTEEMAAACPGIATSIFDSSLGLEPLILSDNEALKKKIFARVLLEGSRVSFATSEPTMGSDVSGIRCEARDAGDHYLLTGTKYWITNGGVSHFMSVFATVDPKAGHAGIGAFLVDMQCHGITVGKPIPKMGQRCSNTVGVHFNQVKVPKTQVLAEPGQGFALAMKTFARTRPIIGAFAVGAARSAMEFALDYAKKRRAFGSPLSDFQAIQFKLAEMYQKVETARLLTWKAAWKADQGQDPTIDASIAKFYATEAAWEVVDEAMQILGGYGYTKMFPVEKLMRDIRLLRIYEGTSEIQRLIVSGWLLSSYKPAMPPLEDLPLHREVDPETSPDQTAWRCRVCGYVHYGEAPPEVCPTCFFPVAAFKNG
ncbi:acyl-CoA dehydrogenase family protein [Desulfoluna sp.]|uniref:acyl-CoA dehydrogenase family protein n=1 Tax=Desulfoluna sp. TaxID=2045199 RepID=UPI00262F1690|nr:acyl-CoA dehydrogenase family protein [Desulfoluna sp.]